MTLITTILNHAQITEKKMIFFLKVELPNAMLQAGIWHVKHDYPGHMSS